MDAPQQAIVDLITGISTATPIPGVTGRPYPLAIAFSALSLLVAMIITPPLFWHVRNRNVGASVLVALAIYANLESFINAIIWSNDDIVHWYNGKGLCDIEVGLELAAQVAFPASLACILKALARVLDTDNAVLMKTKSQQRRAHVIDLVWCVFIPLIQIPLHYIVQGWRYFIYGIAGCVPAADNSWLAVVLLIVPPLLWTLLDVYYSVLILIRLVKYRLTFDTILAHSNTSKSRFLRLYLLCLVCVLGWFPTEIFLLYTNAAASHDAFSWSHAHDPSFTHSAVLVSSNGQLFLDRYIWLTGGLIIFFFFGFGKEAVGMYREALLCLGLGRVFPSLKTPNRHTPSGPSRPGFSQTRLGLLLSKGRSTLASFRITGSSPSKSMSVSTTSDGLSPQRSAFADAFQEKPYAQPIDQSSITSTAIAGAAPPTVKEHNGIGNNGVVVMTELQQISESGKE